MKHLLNHPVQSHVNRWAAITALLGSGVLSCSEAQSPTPATVSQAGQGGGGGQSAGAAGAAGSALTAGAAGKASGGSGGTPPAGGSAGTAGLGGGGAGGGGAGGSGGGGGGGNDGWVQLFNGTNLDGWEVHGSEETLFVVANGEIHVYPTQPDQSEQPIANLVHDRKMSGKYTLHVEYKWGEKRYSDRKQTDRDAGILFHITGNASAVWPDSIEFQLGSSQVGGPWVSGDLYVLGVPTVAQVKNDAGQFVTIGEGPGCCHPSPTKVHAEHAHGEWNTVQVNVDGGAEAIFMLNGVEVNRVYNMTYDNAPLTEGFISIQAEMAELFYRNIRYRLN